MVMLWLIQFLLVVLILVVLVVTGQKFWMSFRSKNRATEFAQELVTFQEAKNVILQHAYRQVERGVPFEQAVLKVLSDHYWPDAE